VELKISKEPGLVLYDMVAKFSEAGIESQVRLSETPQFIDFTPAKVVKYPIYRSKSAPFFKNHRQKGMEGVIEVVP
jgi:hypothetical protein